MVTISVWKKSFLKSVENRFSWYEVSMYIKRHYKKDKLEFVLFSFSFRMVGKPMISQWLNLTMTRLLLRKVFYLICCFLIFFSFFNQRLCLNILIYTHCKKNLSPTGTLNSVNLYARSIRCLAMFEYINFLMFPSCL